MPESVLIARCSQHGLNGTRPDCVWCGPVEQVAMIEHEQAMLDAITKAVDL